MRKIDNFIFYFLLTSIFFIGVYCAGEIISNPIIIEKTEILETIKIVKPKKPSYEYLKSITVYIIGEIPGKKKEDGTTGKIQSWLGTGTVIKVKQVCIVSLEGIECSKAETYILTNAHVAGDKKENVTLFVQNGLKKVEAKIVAYHPNDSIDLAVIKIEGKVIGKQPVKGISIAKPQDPVYLVGHHLGRKYVYGEGVFAGYDRIYNIIQIPTLFGNSGTAVCNKDGELISVIFAVNGYGFFQVDGSHGLGISGLSVKLFLQKLNLLWTDANTIKRDLK